ncbi:hypothetical protein HHK36_008097 [Tetracentron sinense]|uniref:Uncharacterized protein n=1 Tax=Tetracentron sinense TaxID=13715 RepID=A0A834ZFX1_TETSI|nr:hypothetical protein HHK36_008097 [Tetracentron sinense]
MGRSPSVEIGLKKGPWTPEEDQKLVQHIHKHGHGSWRALAKLAVAMAQLRDLMGHHPWEEHAVRLKAETIQLAKLQYLQNLQFSTPMAASSYSQTSITDMEAFKLLNPVSPIYENPILNSPQLENPTPCSFEISTTQPLQDLIPFSHLPALQGPCNFQTSLNSEIGQGSLFTVFSQEGDIPKSLWVPPSPSPPVLPITETSISDPGDTCSTSSYGRGTPFWPELLLEDPLFHEIS